MSRQISLARYQATTSEEARQRARAAMEAYKEAIAKRPHKGKRLQARQAQLPFARQARADFAMYDHDEAMTNRK